jgi:hypothetical protein
MKDNLIAPSLFGPDVPENVTLLAKKEHRMKSKKTHMPKNFSPLRRTNQMRENSCRLDSPLAYSFGSRRRNTPPAPTH